MADLTSEHITAIIVAGGRGVRLGHDMPKPLVPLGPRPMVSYALETFERHPSIGAIVLVCGDDWLDEAVRLGKKWTPTKFFAATPGGAERYDSVQAGLKHLPRICRYVAVHDAGRPFVSPNVIDRTLQALIDFDGSVPGLPLADTLRKVASGQSSGARNRSQYVLTQTPQCFHRAILERAYLQARQDGFTGTDDASYVERLPGARIAVVEGDDRNFKITTSEDLSRALTMIQEGSVPAMRCGEGFDAHRYTAGRKLILGGVDIPFDLGLHGHSDADVLCHAIGDALLGALALGDLGKHFPDTDPAYKGVSSIALLSHINNMITRQGYTIGNIDATVVAQLPKIAPHRDNMRENIAEALNIDVERVSVKATTTEGMGPFGRGEGIACRAVAVVVKQ